MKIPNSQNDFKSSLNKALPALQKAQQEITEAVAGIKNIFKPSFSYLQQMDILLRMESALAGEGNMVVYCLKKAIADKQPTSLIIRETKDMIRDNYNAMADVLGVKLTETIKNFEI